MIMMGLNPFCLRLLPAPLATQAPHTHCILSDTYAAMMPIPPLPALSSPPLSPQVIIVNFLGVVFKIEPLNWQEWLVTVAIGAGAMIWSLAVRLVSRTVCAGSGNGGCWTAITARLVRLNQVKSKQLTAAAAVYDTNKLCGVQLSVHDAVTLAREKTANKATQEQEEEEAAGSKSWLKRLGKRGKAGTKEERTLSGRSDSAGSLGRSTKDVSRF